MLNLGQETLKNNIYIFYNFFGTELVKVVQIYLL